MALDSWPGNRFLGCGVVATLALVCSACGSSGGGGADGGFGAVDASGAVVFDAQPCATDCPAPAPVPVTEQQVIIESVDFVTDTLVLRNVSGGQIDTASWQLCQGPGSYQSFDSMMWEDGESLSTIVFDGIDESSELGVYSSPSFTDSAAIEAYARWGTDDATTPSVRESVAIGATPPRWTDGDFVAVCSGDQGIVATGRSDISDGFRSIGTACFATCCAIDGTCLDVPLSLCGGLGVQLFPDEYTCETLPSECPDERQGACCQCGDPVTCEDAVTVDACGGGHAGEGSTCAQTDCVAVCGG
jgi:hypothetical protein